MIKAPQIQSSIFLNEDIILGYFPNKILLELKDGTMQVPWEKTLRVEMTRLPGLGVQCGQ